MGINKIGASFFVKESIKIELNNWNGSLFFCEDLKKWNGSWFFVWNYALFPLICVNVNEREFSVHSQKIWTKFTHVHELKIWKNMSHSSLMNVSELKWTAFMFIFSYLWIFHLAQVYVESKLTTVNTLMSHKGIDGTKNDNWMHSLHFFFT